MANYVCHRTDGLIEGGRDILVCCCIDHNAITVQGLKHLEATAIQNMLASKPVNILVNYPSPSRPLIASDLSACLGGGLPIPMPGDLKANHADWKSRMIMPRGRLIRD
jgi:hypothetical protein